MVDELGECQRAFQNIDGIREGFLSAYSEEQFDLLEEYTPYPKIWAPYYTLHKIIAGLLDCYLYIDKKEALPPILFLYLLLGSAHLVLP